MEVVRTSVFRIAKEQMLLAWKQIAPERSPAADNPLIQADLVYFPSNYRIPAALSRRYQMERVDRYIALLRRDRSPSGLCGIA